MTKILSSSVNKWIGRIERPKYSNDDENCIDYNTNNDFKNYNLKSYDKIKYQYDMVPSSLLCTCTHWWAVWWSWGCWSASPHGCVLSPCLQLMTIKIIDHNILCASNNHSQKRLQQSQNKTQSFDSSILQRPKSDYNSMAKKTVSERRLNEGGWVRQSIWALSPVRMVSYSLIWRGVSLQHTNCTSLGGKCWAFRVLPRISVC